MFGRERRREIGTPFRGVEIKGPRVRLEATNFFSFEHRPRPPPGVYLNIKRRPGNIGRGNIPRPHCPGALSTAQESGIREDPSRERIKSETMARRMRPTATVIEFFIPESEGSLCSRGSRIAFTGEQASRGDYDETLASRLRYRLVHSATTPRPLQPCPGSAVTLAVQLMENDFEMILETSLRGTRDESE